MAKQNIIMINGKSYDSITGLPVEAATSQPANSPNVPAPKRKLPATAIHTSLQKSQTLNRRAIKRPQTTQKQAVITRKPGRTMDIARSSAVARFAPHPVMAPVKRQISKAIDIAPALHPTLTRALAKLPNSRPAATNVAQSPQDIKKTAIAKAMAQPAVKPSTKPTGRRHKRNWTIVGIVVAVALILSYILYLNLPVISVQIASMQAGIQASYPSYVPNGYALDGPVTYDNSQVNIVFAATTGNAKFTLAQSKSSWDSTAVLQNIVQKSAGNNYLTTEESGLTIYSYGDDAAWVNGGILYTISGNAILSGDQIGNIATSMQ